MKGFKLTMLLALLSGLFLLLSSTATKACTFKASYSGDTMVCSGNSVTYSTPPTPTHYYRWVVQGGAIVSTSGSYSITVYWASPGTGLVRLIDSINGCKDSLSHKIHVTLSNATLSASTYTPNFNAAGGAATVFKPTVSGTTWTMTNGTGNEYTDLWNNSQISMNKNFDFTFYTNQNGGADGLTFVIQNTGINAIGGSQGSDMGYYTAPNGNFAQSIAVEQDIYNSGTGSGYYDSSGSHMSLVKNDNASPLRTQVNISPSLGGGGTNKLRIVWIRDINRFQVFLNGNQIFTWTNDLVKNIFNGNPNVWFGFGAATGGVSSTQTVQNDTLMYGFPYISAAQDTICSGDSVKLIATAGLNYLWSTGAKTRSIYVKTGGSYTVTVGDSFKCSYTSPAHNIVVLSKPTAAFSMSSPCLGQLVSPTNSSTPTSGLNFIWRFGNGDSSTAVGPLYHYLASGNYTVTLTANNGGCSNTSSKSITVYDVASGVNMFKSSPFLGQYNNGDAVTPDAICLGDTNTYQISSPKGLSNSDYGTKWKIASISITTTKGTPVTDTLFKYPTSSKNAIFRLTPSKKWSDSLLVFTIHIQRLPGNCDTLITRYIQVRPKVVSKFGATNACQNLPVAFVDSSTVTGLSSVTHWSWDFGDKITSNAQSPKHTYASPGTYKVTLTATSDAGCGISVSKSVIEYSNPKTAIFSKNDCQNTPILFIDTSTTASGTLASRKWTFGDGQTFSSSKVNSISHSYAKSGFYNVKLSVVSSLGCKDSLTEKFRVQFAPKPIVNVLNACVGKTIYIGNISIDSASTLGTPTYKWAFGDGATSTSTASVSHVYAKNGTYNMVLTITTKPGCTDSLVTAITPSPAPTPNFGFTTACAGKTVTFTDSSKNGTGSSATWYYGDGASDLVGNNTTKHAYAKAGPYTVKVVVTNGQGCTDSESRSIVISDYPKAGFTANEVCVGKTTSFKNTSTISSGNINYLWNFEDGSKVNTTQNPTHAFATSGSYTVKLAAYSDGGCADTAKVSVKVDALPVVAPWKASINTYTVTFSLTDTSQKSYVWHFGTGDSSTSKKPIYTYPSVKQTYHVSVTVTNTAGCSATYTDTLSVNGTGIEQGLGPNPVSVFPNPFEGTTNISYSLNAKSRVTLSVFDAQGKQVAELKNGTFEAGAYNDAFDAKKYHAAPGMYTVKLMVNDEVFMAKVVNTK